MGSIMSRSSCENHAFCGDTRGTKRLIHSTRRTGGCNRPSRRGHSGAAKPGRPLPRAMLPAWPCQSQHEGNHTIAVHYGGAPARMAD